MNASYDDRRTEPRFPAEGGASITRADQRWDASILDLSLNGVMTSQPEGCFARSGERMHMSLSLPNRQFLNASVVLVYAHEGRMGWEFYDMDRDSFGQLARVIYGLSHGNP